MLEEVQVKNIVSFWTWWFEVPWLSSGDVQEVGGYKTEAWGRGMDRMKDLGISLH